MSTDRDAGLQALFAQAQEEFEAQAFTDNVMARIDRLRKRTMYGWAAGGIVLVAVAAVIAGPVQDAVALTTQFLPQSLIDVENRWAEQLLSPINSIAGVVAICLLGLRAAYKKLFS